MVLIPVPVLVPVPVPVPVPADTYMVVHNPTQRTATKHTEQCLCPVSTPYNFTVRRGF